LQAFRGVLICCVFWGEQQPVAAFVAAGCILFYADERSKKRLLVK